MSIFFTELTQVALFITASFILALILLGAVYI